MYDYGPNIFEVIGGLLAIVGIGVLFLLPTIIAFKRNHQDRIAILLITFSYYLCSWDGFLLYCGLSSGDKVTLTPQEMLCCRGVVRAQK